MTNGVVYRNTENDRLRFLQGYKATRRIEQALNRITEDGALRITEDPYQRVTEAGKS